MLDREILNRLSEEKTKLFKDCFSAQVDKLLLGGAVSDLLEALEIYSGRIFIADGPSHAQRIVSSVLGTQAVENEILFKGVDASLRDSKPLHTSIDKSVQEIALRSRNELRESLDPSVARELRNMLFWDLNFQASIAIYNQIHKSLFSPNADHKYSTHLAYSDLDWIGFYSILESVLDLKFPIPAPFAEALRFGLFAVLPFDRFLVVVPRPQKLLRNENLVLHSEDKAAASWEDGTQLYFWNGIAVPQKLIESPELITASDILSETNAEVRRCYQEKLGSERFGQLLGLLELDRNEDRFGNEQVLYRTLEKDQLAGDYIYFAKVICPSTARVYFLCVPPGMKTAEEAVAWTFGKKPSDYKPFIET